MEAAAIQESEADHKEDEQSPDEIEVFCFKLQENDPSVKAVFSTKVIRNGDEARRVGEALLLNRTVTEFNFDAKSYNAANEKDSDPTHVAVSSPALRVSTETRSATMKTE